MRAFFSAPQKINLGCTAITSSSSATLLKNVVNKNGKLKHVE